MRLSTMIRLGFIDTSTELGVRAEQRLRSERTIWLSTVASDNTPSVRPLWFVWDGERFLIFSKPTAAKLRHIAANPKVCLHLDPDDSGENIVIVSGEARKRPTTRRSMRRRPTSRSTPGASSGSESVPASTRRSIRRRSSSHSSGFARTTSWLVGELDRRSRSDGRGGSERGSRRSNLDHRLDRRDRAKPRRGSRPRPLARVRGRARNRPRRSRLRAAGPAV